MRSRWRAALLVSAVLLAVSACDAGPVPDAGCASCIPNLPLVAQNAAPMLQARMYHSMTVLRDGRVLVAGGQTSQRGRTLATAELYDPATDVWRPTTHMAQARAQHSATLLASGKVLVTGGLMTVPATMPGCFQAFLIDQDFGPYLVDSNLPPVCVILQRQGEVWDPTTDQWTPTRNTQAASLPSTALLPSGEVLLLGGYDQAGRATTNAERYDPATNQFEPISALLEARGEAAVAVLTSGEVLTVGGSAWYISGPLLSSAERYQPDAGTWRAAVPNPYFAPFSRGTALLPSGEALVAGGFVGTDVSATNFRNITGRSARYDPVSDAWQLTPPMVSKRYMPVFVTLPSGEVLVFGGCFAGGIVERYRSIMPGWSAEGNAWDGIGAWTSLASLTADVAGCGLNAAVLNDGGVLVTGGMDSSLRVDFSTGAVRSAQVYQTN